MYFDLSFLVFSIRFVDRDSRICYTTQASWRKSIDVGQKVDYTKSYTVILAFSHITSSSFTEPHHNTHSSTKFKYKHNQHNAWGPVALCRITTTNRNRPGRPGIPIILCNRSGGNRSIPVAYSLSVALSSEEIVTRSEPCGSYHLICMFKFVPSGR